MMVYSDYNITRIVTVQYIEYYILSIFIEIQGHILYNYTLSREWNDNLHQGR